LSPVIKMLNEGSVYMVNQILALFEEMKQTQKIEVMKRLNDLIDNTQEIVRYVDENNLTYLSVNEIKYITIDKKKSSIYLADGSLLTSKSLKDNYFDHYLTRGFVYVDRYTMVNLSHVKWYDLDYFRIYFSDVDYINVAGAALKKIKPILGSERDIKNAPSYSQPFFSPIR